LLCSVNDAVNVLCSSPLRTRETLAAILPALGDALEIRIERALYGGGPALAGLREKVPTGALTTVELDVERWRDLDHGTGTATILVTPRSLESGRKSDNSTAARAWCDDPGSLTRPDANRRGGAGHARR
jgi:hypothetical protein